MWRGLRHHGCIPARRSFRRLSVYMPDMRFHSFAPWVVFRQRKPFLLILLHEAGGNLYAVVQFNPQADLFVGLKHDFELIWMDSELVPIEYPYDCGNESCHPSGSAQRCVIHPNRQIGFGNGCNQAFDFCRSGLKNQHGHAGTGGSALRKVVVASHQARHHLGRIGRYTPTQ